MDVLGVEDKLLVLRIVILNPYLGVIRAISLGHLGTQPHTWLLSVFYENCFLKLGSHPSLLQPHRLEVLTLHLLSRVWLRASGVLCSGPRPAGPAALAPVPYVSKFSACLFSNSWDLLPARPWSSSGHRGWSQQTLPCRPLGRGTAPPT